MLSTLQYVGHSLSEGSPRRPELFKDIQPSYLVNRTYVAEPSEPIAPVIGTHATRADATERQPVLCNMEKSPVDCDATGTDLFENPVLSNFVIAETVERQCFWSLIDEIERFFERFVRNNRQDWPEYLILQHRAPCGGAEYDRRGDRSLLGLWRCR